MKSDSAVYGFADGWRQAQAVAAAVGVPCYHIGCHHFPDGESRVRIAPLVERPIVFRSLYRPNEKLIELLLAASVLATAGRRTMLAAPYLPYMRQDTAFRRGEAVSQRVIGRLLAGAFAQIIGVDPHLHRAKSLQAVFPGARAIAVSAAPLLARAIDRASSPLIVGPDSESEPLVAAVADAVRLDHIVLAKTRRGDRAVSVRPPHGSRISGRPAVLVDDIASTGETLVAAARTLAAAGAISIEALVVHACFDESAGTAMTKAGIVRVRSTDTVPHPSNAIAIAPLIAESIRKALE